MPGWLPGRLPWLLGPLGLAWLCEALGSLGYVGFDEPPFAARPVAV